MICKDTIEDKILQLQDRKRSLARELIADDDGFVKNLTKRGCLVSIQLNYVRYGLVNLTSPNSCFLPFIYKIAPPARVYGA